jgi:site-specific DNA recombinase
VIEGYNEYYSRNLAREVMKGLKENALAAKFNGGLPPLGYDINKDTLKYEINDFEAEAVKLIFKMYLQGEGYTPIINELNRRGFRTKRGNKFGKNSLYDILRNERYVGTYIYNKSVSHDSDKKFNRHASKNADEIIRIEGGLPQIISEEDFNKVQLLMNNRKRRAAAYKAKEEYLLSGKIICGECGSTYAGNARRSKNSTYISYTCTKKNGREKCRNRGTQRDLIESIILNKLSEKVFDVKILPEIISRYNDFALSKNKEFIAVKKQLEQRLAEIDKGIANIVNLVVTTGSAALAEKLKELELEKVTLEISLKEAERKLSEMSVDEAQLRKAFSKAKSLLKSGTLKNRKAIVQQYVKQVVMYPDKVEIEFNVIGDSYTIKESYPR